MTYTVISMGIAIASIIVSIYLLFVIHTLRDEVLMLHDQNHFYMERYDNILKNWSRCTKLVGDVISNDEKIIAINKELLKSDDVYDD